jgi:hypothetical protein
MFEKLFNTKEGNILISIILGLGLASLFRNICKNGKCIVYTSPVDEIQKNFYKIDDTCIQYKPNIIPCDSTSVSHNKQLGEIIPDKVRASM